MGSSGRGESAEITSAPPFCALFPRTCPLAALYKAIADTSNNRRGYYRLLAKKGLLPKVSLK